jgi:hypothetical protein
MLVNKIRLENFTDNQINHQFFHLIVMKRMIVRKYFCNFIYLFIYLLDDVKQRDAPELVDIESWFLRSDMLYKYECEHIDENNRRHPR